jgi:very-short-patch-repair endonuclease
LDFAIWCKKGAIDIECDGDTFHMDYDNVHYDKTRNNELESYGWSVLRFTKKHFKEDTAHIEKTIYKTVKKLGGAVKVSEPNDFYLPKKSDESQLGLFE